MDYMRTELINRFTAAPFTVTINGAATLDCIWIPSISEHEAAPTLIFCNPNSGYYETTYYQTEWLDFYTSHGINLVLWNYRGYSRSPGTPDPNVICSDGEVLVRYLRKERGVKILGIHGESIGGFFATQLALRCNLDFLFCDRSFASINEICYYDFGIIASFLFSVIMRWKLESSMSFL
jgi:alpha/beta superfamily hydrolase